MTEEATRILARIRQFIINRPGFERVRLQEVLGDDQNFVERALRMADMAEAFPGTTIFYNFAVNLYNQKVEFDAEIWRRIFQLFDQASHVGFRDRAQQIRLEIVYLHSGVRKDEMYKRLVQETIPPRSQAEKEKTAIGIINQKFRPPLSI